jgi:hypothetical protein
VTVNVAVATFALESFAVQVTFVRVFSDQTVSVAIRDFGLWRNKSRQGERGLGFRMMRSLMDAVEVTRAGRNLRHTAQTSPGTNTDRAPRESRLEASWFSQPRELVLRDWPSATFCRDLAGPDRMQEAQEGINELRRLLVRPSSRLRDAANDLLFLDRSAGSSRQNRVYDFETAHHGHTKLMSGFVMSFS